MNSLISYHNDPSTCSKKVRLVLGLKGLDENLIKIMKF
jgi:hypothetical protein